MVPLVEWPDVAIAQAAARQFAEEAGASKREQWEFATAVSEAATNVLKHGTRGSITLRLTSASESEPCVEFVAIDVGSGIQDVDRALRDGISREVELTNGIWSPDGMGCGLGAIQRLMHTVTIRTPVAGGTEIVARKRFARRP